MLFAVYCVIPAYLVLPLTLFSLSLGIIRNYCRCCASTALGVLYTLDSGMFLKSAWLLMFLVGNKKPLGDARGICIVANACQHHLTKKNTKKPLTRMGSEVSGSLVSILRLTVRLVNSLSLCYACCDSKVTVTSHPSGGGFFALCRIRQVPPLFQPVLMLLVIRLPVQIPTPLTMPD